MCNMKNYYIWTKNVCTLIPSMEPKWYALYASRLREFVTKVTGTRPSRRFIASAALGKGSCPRTSTPSMSIQTPNLGTWSNLKQAAVWGGLLTVSEMGRMMSSKQWFLYGERISNAHYIYLYLWWIWECLRPPLAHGPSLGTICSECIAGDLSHTWCQHSFSIHAFYLC